jgi:hypothetical protein
VGVAISYLADNGFPATVLTVPIEYPMPIARKIHSISVNVSTALVGGTNVVVELRQNGIPIAGFGLLFLAASTPGILTSSAGPINFAVGDTMHVRTTGTGGDQTFNVTAMIGIE